MFYAAINDCVLHVNSNHHIDQLVQECCLLFVNVNTARPSSEC